MRAGYTGALSALRPGTFPWAEVEERSPQRVAQIASLPNARMTTASDFLNTEV